MVARVFCLLLCARLSLQISPGRLSGGGQCIDDDWGCTWAKMALRFACPFDGAIQGLFQSFGPMSSAPQDVDRRYTWQGY